MRNLGARLVPLVLLLALAAATLWLERATQVDAGRLDGKNRHDPDFVVDDLTVRRFAPDGKIQHTLNASQMRHYPDDDSTEVSSPQVIFHRGARPASLSAKSAWISKDGKEVILEEDVRYARRGLKGDPDTVVATSRLTVFPDEETASSDRTVTITQGNSLVTGTGVEADNRQRVAVLRGRVHGTIYRNQPRS